MNRNLPTGGFFCMRHKKQTIEIYDTTLRDGNQSIYANFSTSGKINVARLLYENLPIDIIEGGWPGANPTDTEFFQKAKTLPFFHKLAAFGMTCKAGISVENDPYLSLLINSNAPIITLVGKTDLHHIENVFRTTGEENLRMIEESVRFANKNKRRVIFDAEHFFDGYVKNPGYAIKTLLAAKKGGADTLVLCDTNGGQLPDNIKKIVTSVIKKLDRIRIGIHAHNDRMMAIANTLAAVEAGVTHIQGTIGGIGERVGNADLLVLLDVLDDMGFIQLPKNARSRFKEIYDNICETAGIEKNPFAPLVGKYCFSTKAGMHQDAIVKVNDPCLYSFRDPKAYGNELTLIITNQSGSKGVEKVVKQFGFSEKTPKEKIKKLTLTIKEQEYRGYRYVKAVSSLENLARKTLDTTYISPFTIKMMTQNDNENANAVLYFPENNKTSLKKQMLLVKIKKSRYDTIFTLLQKKLVKVYPKLEQVQLQSHLLEQENGTKRVYLQVKRNDQTWTACGIGVTFSEAFINASADALEYAYWHTNQ